MKKKTIPKLEQKCSVFGMVFLKVIDYYNNNIASEEKICTIIVKVLHGKNLMIVYI